MQPLGGKAIIIRRKLLGSVTDCGVKSASCFLTLGYRMAEEKGGAYRLRGILYSSSIISNKYFGQLPAVPLLAPTKSPSSPSEDWLAAGSSALLRTANKKTFFVSSPAQKTGLSISQGILAPTWSVAIKLVVKTGGYLFAKTSADGTTRHYSLYCSRSRGSLVLYYQLKGSTALQSEQFKINLLDGSEYRVLYVLPCTTCHGGLDSVAALGFLSRVLLVLAIRTKQCLCGGAVCRPLFFPPSSSLQTIRALVWSVDLLSCCGCRLSVESKGAFTHMRLTVDDVEVGGVRAVNGQLSDCDTSSGDCVLNVGRRVSYYLSHYLRACMHTRTHV